jgi:uncharacterized membrane protein
MSTGRLEAFSDGVIAVIITIMVLELHAPPSASTGALERVAPSFLVYLLSFVLLAIIWVNHHHVLRSARRASARLLWTNNNLLFWISLIPFVTEWLGKNPAATTPVALYAVVLTLVSSSFAILRIEIARQRRADGGTLTLTPHGDRKILIATAAYCLSIALAFISVYLAYAIFLSVPAAYFIPDRELENST